MNGTNDQSYLFLGFGRQYIDDSIDCIETLRHFRDDRSINIAINKTDEEYTKNKKVFTNIIVLDLEKDPLMPLCSTNFEKFGLLPRLRLPQLLSTKYTIVIDTDILCSYYTDSLWKYFIDIKQPLIMIGSKNNTDWHWGHWGSICKNINICPYETHGGIFFIDNSDQKTLQNIWNDAIYAFKDYDNLGMKRLYQGGSVDEPCFAYSFNKNNLIPIEFSEFPSITFNLQAMIESIPTKNMTENKQKKIMNDYIPFIHMFEKNHTLNFRLLKNKILQHKR